MFFSIFIAVFLSITSTAQVAGCTDPQALNYNPEATLNDGSCQYPATSIFPTVIVNPLPQPVNETSGLIFWNGGLWTQNDSGNEPKLYKLDTITGQILQTITIEGAENIDWEDLAQDDSRIFIGDFGNNIGNRTDLKIYVAEKSVFPAEGDGSVPATVINFSYGDQQNFERANRNNDYDCESLLASGDSLYLFTKNWVNEQSRLYSLPKVAGEYQIFPLASFDTDGLITGADFLAGGNEVVLCGYKNYIPFMWLLFDFSENRFFSGNKRRIGFSGLPGTQTEGICYTFGKNVYISSEKTTISPAKLFRINTSPWTITIPTGIDTTTPDGQGFLLFPNPNDGLFRLELGDGCSGDNYRAEVINSSGVKVINNKVTLTNCAADVNLPGLAHGLYLLRIYNEDVTFSGKLLVNK